MKKFLVLLLAALIGGNSFAYKTTVPTQYSGLQWTVSGLTGLEPYAYCTSMTLNGVTDFANNSIISLAGTLNCNNGANAYVVNGAGYLNTVGGISLGLTVSGLYYWNCQTDALLNASCSALNAYGAVGSPKITFK